MNVEKHESSLLEVFSDVGSTPTASTISKINEPLPVSLLAGCRLSRGRFTAVFQLNVVSVHDGWDQSRETLVDLRAARRVVHLDPTTFASN
jgi:hypothetical protein